MQNLIDLIFPQGIYCVICGKYIDDKRPYGICDHCIERMNFDCQEILGSQFFDYGFAAMGYGLYERRLIFNLKYDGRTYLARSIANIIFDSLMSKACESANTRDLLKADLIIPIPVHKRRLKERGFNQADKIAKHLGKRLGIDVEYKTLIRAKETSAQRALSAMERRANMDDAFAVRGSKFQGKSVILLDDIYTTGATANAAAKVLKEAGAKKIYLLTLLSAGNRHHLMVK